MSCAMIDSCSKEVAQAFLNVTKLEEARPDLAFLVQLTRAFGRLPYENVTKILRAAETGDPVRRLREPATVLEEHLALGAGGTCFSLTNFFEGILRSVGFETQPVLCDRSYGADTHCALIVPVEDDRYLVDPGYLLTAPIPVPDRGEIRQAGPQGTLRLARLGESRQLLLISEGRGRPKIRYRLRDETVERSRFVARWIDSFGWAQMRHVCISRQAEGGQCYLRDGRLRWMGDGGGARQERVTEGLAMTVEARFGIDRGLVARAEEVVRDGRETFVRPLVRSFSRSNGSADRTIE